MFKINKSYWFGMFFFAIVFMAVFFMARTGFFYPVDTGERIYVEYPDRLSELDAKEYLTQEERDEREELLKQYYQQGQKAIEDYQLKNREM